MRIRLLTAMKVRNADGGHVILNPGIYDSESSDFPEALRNESRADVVKFLDSPVLPGNPARGAAFSRSAGEVGGTPEATNALKMVL